MKVISFRASDEDLNRIKAIQDISYSITGIKASESDVIRAGIEEEHEKLITFALNEIKKSEHMNTS